MLIHRLKTVDSQTLCDGTRNFEAGNRNIMGPGPASVRDRYWDGTETWCRTGTRTKYLTRTSIEEKSLKKCIGPIFLKFKIALIQ